ncbi:T9SS type A sorting domain-containing protein [Lewinella sp. LCG006]|uniref:T9SS type A sorting domain-containing protein n=1 Tax=Lewinella sp. LCG006 TaxID=3231911 RepID=UPI00345F7DCA
MKAKLILSILHLSLFVLLSNSLNAQIYTQLITGLDWQSYFINGRLSNASPYSTVINGPWGTVAAPVGMPNNCLSTPISYPATPIFHPEKTSCDSGPITTYYKKEFTLEGGENEICAATVTLRADDYSRLYVDGTLVPGFTELGCHWTIIPEMHNLITDDWHDVVTVDIINYLDPGLDTHTVVFEVGNCIYQTYLAATINITQEMSCIPDAQVNYSSQDGGRVCELTFSGTQNCYTHEDWIVFYTPVIGQPYQKLYEVRGNSRIGAAKMLELPTGCNYYRIYHKVWHTKCDGTIVSHQVLTPIFSICCSSDGGTQLLQNTNDEAESTESYINEFLEKETDPRNQIPILSLRNAVGIYPNPTTNDINIRFDEPFTGQIKLVDALGRLVNVQTVQETISTSFDLSAQPIGLYWVITLSGDQQQQFKVVKQ